MQNSNRNYITAGILILLGVLFLGKEFNLFDFHWGDIARFWPVLLIVIGLNHLFGSKTSSSATSIILIICLIAIPLGMMRSCHDNWNENGNRFHWNDRNWDDNNDNDNDNNDDDNDNTHNDSDDDNHYSKSQNFTEDMDASIKSAQLTIEGGVAGIDIDGTTEKLFEADTKSTFSDFGLSKTVTNGVANVRFTMINNNKDGKDNHIDIDSDDFDGKNEAKIKLNPNIEWNMDYKFGVAGADMDLSPFNVKSIEIKTGVSGVDIKLGDKANDVQVDIDAGIAGITLKVPNGVGVRIKSDSFMSGNNFEGFTKDGSGYYLSPDYSKSTKKITVNYKGAFASFDVDRY